MVRRAAAAAVGKPERVPEALRERPAGSWPAAMVQAYGLVPPVAANGWVYVAPTMPEEMAVVVIESGPTVVMVNC